MLFQQYARRRHCISSAAGRPRLRYAKACVIYATGATRQSGHRQATAAALTSLSLLRQSALPLPRSREVAYADATTPFIIRRQSSLYFAEARAAPRNIGRALAASPRPTRLNVVDARRFYSGDWLLFTLRSLRRESYSATRAT